MSSYVTAGHELCRLVLLDRRCETQAVVRNQREGRRRRYIGFWKIQEHSGRCL